MMWLIYVIVAYFIFRLVKFWIVDSWRIHRDLASQGIPGRYIPIVGELLHLRSYIMAEKPLVYNTDMARDFGNYYRISLGPIAGLNIAEPSLIDGVLKTNARFYQKSIFMHLIIGSLIGNDNLLTGEHDVHARHRRLINPLFQHQNVNSMISMMVDITSNHLNKWAQLACQTKNGKATVDIREQMARLALSILAGCVFGKEISNCEETHESMYQSVTVILNELEKRLFNLIAIIPLINRLPIPSKVLIDQHMQSLHHVVGQIIEERQKGLTMSTAKGPDLLDLLLKSNHEHSNKRITNEEIYGEALTFLLAGHETTSNLLIWTLYNLSCHPEIYVRCQNEIDSVLNTDDTISPSTLSLLNYTEAVLKESLRLYPSIPVLYRTALEDNTLVTTDGKQIRVKKGTEVIVNLYMLHHSEKFWCEPEKFDPSRFLQSQQPSQYLPFSSGIRSCIGQNFANLEAKIMLTMILRRFHIELQPGQKPVPDIAITLRPKYEMWMQVSLR